MCAWYIFPPILDGNGEMNRILPMRKKLYFTNTAAYIPNAAICHGKVLVADGPDTVRAVKRPDADDNVDVE